MMTAIHSPRHAAVVTTFVLLTITSCASSQPSKDTPAPSEEPAGAPVLVWEIVGPADEVNYVAARPPELMPATNVSSVFRSVFENADRSNIVTGPEDSISDANQPLTTVNLPEGQTLKDVIAPDLAAALDTWINSKRFHRPDLFKSIHPSAVAVLVWMLSQQGQGEPKSPTCDEDGFRSTLRRVPASLQERQQEQEYQQLKNDFTKLSVAPGEQFLREMLTPEGLAAVDALDKEAADAFESGDIERFSLARVKLQKEHPLYALAHSLTPTPAIGCDAILNDGSNDAVLLDVQRLNGPTGCLSQYRKRGLTVRQLGKESALRLKTRNFDAAPINRRQLVSETLSIQPQPDPALEDLGLQDDITKIGAGGFYLDGKALIAVIREASTSSQPEKRAPPEHVIVDVDSAKTLARFRTHSINSIYQGAAGHAVILRDLSAGSYSLVQMATGETVEPVGVTEAGAPLKIYRLLGMRDGPLIAIGVRELSPEKIAEAKARAAKRRAEGKPAEPMEVYIANWPAIADPKIVFAEKNRLLTLPVTLASAIDRDDSTFHFGANLPGVLQAPKVEPRCSSFRWRGEAATCERWVGEGRQWVRQRGQLLEAKAKDFRKGIAAVGAADGSVSPLVDCKHRPTFVGQSVAFICKSQVRVWHAGKEHRTKTIEDAITSVSSRGSDALLLQQRNRKGGATTVNLVRPTKGDALELPPDSEVGFAKEDWHLLSVGKGAEERLGMLDATRGKLVWLEGLQCNSRAPMLQFASEQRWVFTCRGGYVGREKQPDLTWFVDAKTGVGASVPGTFFGLSATKAMFTKRLTSSSGQRSTKIESIPLASLPGHSTN